MSRQLAAVIDNGTGYTKMGYVKLPVSWLTFH
jgi:actin-related protein